MLEEFVSCIGVSTAYSIVELCKALDKVPFNAPNRLQSSTVEQGLSCSIILLSVAMTESALNRTRYIIGEKHNRALDFFRMQFDSKATADDLEETYVLRDVITHNHMWKVSVPNSSNLNDPRIKHILLPGYGDKKFRKVINMNTLKTKRLSLNIVPTIVNRKDVLVVLDVVWRICVILQSEDSRYFPLENYPFKWADSKYLKFPGLVQFLKKRWSV
ncbi:MAG: hypothetical protein GWP19_03440 [Planctomycetia bacterium]|nr:hypothetical protein [Planctomycetia bacterium]